MINNNNFSQEKFSFMPNSKNHIENPKSPISAFKISNQEEFCVSLEKFSNTGNNNNSNNANND